LGWWFWESIGVDRYDALEWAMVGEEWFVEKLRAKREARVVGEDVVKAFVCVSIW
jgi:hypothetical protein